MELHKEFINNLSENIWYEKEVTFGFAKRKFRGTVCTNYNNLF